VPPIGIFTDLGIWAVGGARMPAESGDENDAETERQRESSTHVKPLKILELRT
jgi:hypothetical protein